MEPSQLQRKTPILAIVLISYLMIVLDISIVITGLPKIAQELALPTTQLSWVQNAYTLAFGGLLLLGARAGDILGRRRMFMIGMGLFTLASVAIGMAQSGLWILCARAVQGIGSAILAPSTLALLTINFPEGSERTRALGYYGATAGIAASVGLVLGGILADLLSWRVGFFINLPIGLALLFSAYKYLHETERHQGQFDLMGAATSTLGMVALVYGLVRAAAMGWGDLHTQQALVAGVLLLVALVLNEWRAPQPIMPLRLFASRERSGAYIARLLFLGAMMGFWFFTTQFMQIVLGYSPIEAGLAFLPTTIPNFIAAMMVARLSRKLGNGRLLALGLTAALIGMAWLSMVSTSSSYLLGVALPMVLIGIGQGAALSPLTVAGVAGVASKDAGAASGVVNVAHQLGGSLGLSILVVVFSRAATGLSGREQMAHGVATSLMASSIMLLLALAVVLLWVMPKRAQLQPVAA